MSLYHLRLLIQKSVRYALQLVSDKDRNSSLRSPPVSVNPDQSILCFSILPPTYHFSIILMLH
jgi:hypothetical protein